VNTFLKLTALLVTVNAPLPIFNSPVKFALPSASIENYLDVSEPSFKFIFNPVPLDGNN
jgi:hypothetical protein